MESTIITNEAEKTDKAFTETTITISVKYDELNDNLDLKMDLTGDPMNRKRLVTVLAGLAGQLSEQQND